MNISEEFRQIRRVSTPLVAVSTPDYRAIMKQLAAVRFNGDDDEPPIVMWNVVSGHTEYNEAGRDAANRLGDAADTVAAPSMFLDKLRDIDEQTIVFMVIPTNQMLDDPQVVQAIANLRDLFKKDRRTLVLLGRSLNLPALISEDVMQLTEELPGDDDLQSVIKFVYTAAKVKPPANLESAIVACRGMTRFATEEAAARKLSQSGLDIAALRLSRKETIERACEGTLKFETSPWTFNDLRGMDSWRSFAAMLWSGPLKPSVVVRIDEMEKSISSAASGAVADSSGTSQDQLKVLLTSMEENRWSGVIAVGGPGTGKSLASICTGNEFGAITLNLDLGACKGSLVGESERKIRQAIDTIKALAGKNAFFFGTCNSLDTLPAALQRRFTRGVWYFETPGPEERRAIWKLHRDKLNIKDDVLPPDDNWTGSDIRNVCETAWACNCSLKTASQMVTLSGVSARSDIDKLRELAARCGFLCANRAGVFRRDLVQSSQSRQIAL